MANEIQGGRWGVVRRRVIVSAILILAPLALVACAIPDGSAVTVFVQDEGFVPIPATDRLEIPSPAEYAYFGAAVAISGDTAVIGAWGESDGGPNAGAAYVFRRAGDAWVQRARLTASDGSAGARFGHAVAVDSGTILVSAIYRDGAASRSGVVYVFDLAGDAWEETDRLMPTDAARDAYFGSAIALDRGTALIGASGPGARSAYVFVETDQGWAEEARLAPGILAPDARFGSSVAIDGDVAAVGAWTEAPDVGSEDGAGVGAVHVFHRSNGGWIESDTLTAPVPSEGDRFGYAVSVSGDTIAVGAPGSPESVYVYQRTGADWALEGELLAVDADARFFGVSVALEDATLVVGAPGAGERAGAVYVFDRREGAWKPRTEIFVPEPDTNLQFGGAVALDIGTTVVGATGGRGGGIASGTAFVVR